MTNFSHNNILKTILLTGFLLAIFFVPSAYAQTSLSDSNHELGISPFLQEFEVPKGGNTSSVINLSNTGSDAVTVNISTKDFLPGQRGQPQFVPDEEINEPTFSLASWIKIKGNTTVTVPPDSVTQIEYTIQPPTNAEQGTHYGAILFSYSSSKELSGVGITQSIGSIVLVSYGEARSQGSMEFSSDKNLIWWNSKVDFTNKFLNTGNVHVKPKGEIEIKNTFGQVVDSLSINRDANNVLPKSDRTFITTWQPGPWSFGRYKAEAVITFGRERLEVRSTEVIWVMPIYILFVIGIFFALLMWYILHGRHWHRRRIIRKHLNTNAKD